MIFPTLRLPVRLIADTAPHHFKCVIYDDYCISINIADGLFKLGEFPEGDDRVQNVLLFSGVSPALSQSIIICRVNAGIPPVSS